MGYDTDSQTGRLYRGVVSEWQAVEEEVRMCRARVVVELSSGLDIVRSHSSLLRALESMGSSGSDRKGWSLVYDSDSFPGVGLYPDC